MVMLRKLLTYLVFLVLFTCILFPSCAKREQSEPLAPTTVDGDKQGTTSQDPESQRPLEENILLAASEEKVEVKGAEETSDGYTVIFAVPFAFSGVEYESVTIGDDFIESIDWNVTSSIEIIFKDKAVAVFEIYYEVALDIEPKLTVCGYMSETVEVPFTVTRLGYGELTFHPDGADGFLPVVEYDEETRSGVIKITLNSVPDAVDTGSVSVVAGEASTKYDIIAKTYRFNVEVEDVTIDGTEGSSASISFKVDTDIPDYVVEYEIEGDFFSFLGGIVTATSENRTGSPRNGRILIFERKRVFSPACINIVQNSLPALPPENCIAFEDLNFKKAMLELCDVDNDGEVSYDEALTVKEIVAVDKGIKNLAGLEYFKNAWKADFENNDIANATVLKELPQLYWLDLKGNKNLKTFDVTGCTQYFEHCEFEITDELIYYTYRQQAGVTMYSDPECKHSRHIPDNRETLDWTHHKNLRKIQTHTKCITQEEFPWIRTGEYYENENHTQEGSVPVIVFTGQGYLDVDFNDGTWERMMNKLISEFWRINTEFTQYKDYFDVYLLEYLVSDRNIYHCRMDAPAESEQVRLALNNILADYDEIAKYSYESLFGETTGINSFNLSYHINPNLGELFTTPSKQYPQMIVVHLDNNPIYTSFIYNGCREWGAFGASSQVTSDLSYKGYVANMYYSTHGRMGTDESDEYWFSYNVIYGLTDIQNFSIEGIIEEAYNYTYSVIERIFKLTGFLSW